MLQVTGYRGEFGPAERAGVQVGWDIIGVSGTTVDSKETLAGERHNCIATKCMPFSALLLTSETYSPLVCV